MSRRNFSFQFFNFIRLFIAICGPLIIYLAFHKFILFQSCRRIWTFRVCLAFIFFFFFFSVYLSTLLAHVETHGVSNLKISFLHGFSIAVYSISLILNFIDEDREINNWIEKAFLTVTWQWKNSKRWISNEISNLKILYVLRFLYLHSSFEVIVKQSKQ